MELLLSRKADINAKTDETSWTVLPIAANSNPMANGTRAAVLLISANGKKDAPQSLAVSSAGWTPLHEAASQDHGDVVALLLANKADVDAKGDEGWTPLLVAAEMGYGDIEKLLLANKADVNS